MPILQNRTPLRANQLENASTNNEQQMMQFTLGSNLYHRRKRRGVSQSELAKKAGVTQTMISEMENGDYNPSMETINKLAEALRIDWSLLVKKNISWKMLEAVAYFLSKVSLVDVLKAMKLLYLTDYEFNQKHRGERIIGREYFRRNRGPFNKEIYQLDDVFNKKNEQYQPCSISKRTELSTNDKQFLDIIIEKYAHMDSTELMKYTYTTKPMEGCTIGGNERMGEKLNVYA